MANRISNSPTPAKVAEAFGQLVSERAEALAGKDGRVSAKEAAQDAFVQAAHAEAGAQRPSPARLGRAGAEAMRAAAEAAAGGDGRVSAQDAAKMPAPLAQAFTELRAKVVADGQVGKTLEQLGKAVEGLLFMSESDDPYVPFHLPLGKDVPLTPATLKATLTWDAEPDHEPSEYHPYPARFELWFSGADAYWKDKEAQMIESGYEPREALQTRAPDRVMGGALVPAKATDSDGNAVEAKLFTVTPSDQDATRAPYYVFGRLPNGDLLGLKTWRTWT
jgi:hypothetical protein